MSHPRLTMLFALVASVAVPAASNAGIVDCNVNGMDDAIDISGSAATYEAFPDLPIPNNNPGGASTSIVVPAGGLVQDVNVALQINHQAQGDVKVTLEHGGVTAILINRPGSNQGCPLPASSYGYFADNYGIGDSPLVLDDEASASGIDCYAGSLATGAVGTFNYAGPDRPTHALSEFDGLAPAGEWTLTVSDHLFYNTGTLNYWALTLTTGTSLDANGNGTPDECEPRRAASVVHSASRKNCDLPLETGALSESRRDGVTQLRIAFDEPPILPDAESVTLEQRTCAAPQFVPYNGSATIEPRVVGQEVVLSFSPGLENARTYRVNLPPVVSSIEGQSVDFRVLLGDVDGNGLVNAVDRSLVVGAWDGGGGFTCPTDVDNNGFTQATDRAIVIGAWTSTQRCAP